MASPFEKAAEAAYVYANEMGAPWPLRDKEEAKYWRGVACAAVAAYQKATRVDPPERLL